jgi:hypothetical protein
MVTMLVARYKVEVKEEPQFAGETFTERRERVLTSRPGLSNTCVFLSIFSLLPLTMRTTARFASRWCSNGDPDVCTRSQTALLHLYRVRAFWTHCETGIHDSYPYATLLVLNGRQCKIHHPFVSVRVNSGQATQIVLVLLRTA